MNLTFFQQVWNSTCRTLTPLAFILSNLLVFLSTSTTEAQGCVPYELSIDEVTVSCCNAVTVSGCNAVIVF